MLSAKQSGLLFKAPKSSSRLYRSHTPQLRTKALPDLRSPLNTVADRIDDPLLRAAVKEPLAFWGGIFAGVLGLNLQEAPLRDWVERTAAVRFAFPVGRGNRPALQIKANPGYYKAAAGQDYEPEATQKQEQQ